MKKKMSRSSRQEMVTAFILIAPTIISFIIFLYIPFVNAIQTSFFKYNGLGPMTDFVGWKNSDEIDKYAVKAKGLVFPSVWYEAAPLTIPEVMGKYGLPCIVSDACAGQDYIHNGINGYIFKNGDVNDLIDKLNLLDMKSKKLQENILHSFNRNMYSKNTHASNLIKEYNKILEKNVKYL